jgi:hypothetical protein
MNGSWFSVILVTTIAAPAFLVLTIAAGIVALFLRSKASLTIFLVLLGCTVLSGACWLAGLLLINSSWP